MRLITPAILRVSIATIENQEFLANQAKLLPKSALETLARDIKASGNMNANQVVPGHKINSSNQIEILQGAECKLVAYGGLATNLAPKQHQIHELHGFLEKREANIVQEKKRLGELKSSVTTTKASRYIPMAIKKVLTEEHGAKCSLMP